MENIINFLNVNNGALMVIITAVYVVATIQICRANIKSAKASNAQVAAAKEQTDAVKAQLDESKREYEETKRLEHMPYMQVSFGEWKTSDERGSYFPNMWLKSITYF